MNFISHSEPANLGRVRKAIDTFRGVCDTKITEFHEFFEARELVREEHARAKLEDDLERGLQEIVRTEGKVGVFGPRMPPPIQVHDPKGAANFGLDIILDAFQHWNAGIHTRLRSIVRDVDPEDAHKARNVINEALTTLYDREALILEHAAEDASRARSGKEMDRILTDQYIKTVNVLNLLTEIYKLLDHGESILAANLKVGTIGDMKAGSLLAMIESEIL